MKNKPNPFETKYKRMRKDNQSEIKSKVMLCLVAQKRKEKKLKKEREKWEL